MALNILVGMVCGAFSCILSAPVYADLVAQRDYLIVDTAQERCFGLNKQTPCISSQGRLSGQDTHYQGLKASYRDNGDGTISDLNTGLIWQKTPNEKKYSQREADIYAQSLILADQDDWRLPTIKELFSIADFNGDTGTQTPYINSIFDFAYPNVNLTTTGRKGPRPMDAQYASSTHSVGRTMDGDKSAFGFNFADGRLKSYPLHMGRYVRAVRGNPNYGKNSFVDNGDGTISDQASGLTWLMADSGYPMNWPQALQYAESSRASGRNDWRLPTIKELQSIVDYERAPDSLELERRSAAIHPIFQITKQESWFWSSTTHIENQFAYYVDFGQALSAQKRRGKPLNAHGAGAVRSDPKEGCASQRPDGLGPKSDEIRIRNYVRLVRDGNVKRETIEPTPQVKPLSSVPQRLVRRPTEKGARGGFINRLDTNGDGAVSLDEFDGPTRHFQHLDRNRDGVLDRTEAPMGPPPSYR